MHDKKNLLKLLPAAAVIAAVAVTAVQGKATDGIQKEPENAEVRDAGELSGLLKTAYFDDDTSADSGTKDIAKAKKKKAKKSGIKKGTAKALPDESKKTSAEGQGSTTTPTTEVPESGYKDGTYTGQARGYSGIVTITLTVKDGKITAVNNTNSDTMSYFRRAWRILQPAILEKQSVDGIDTVSGATFSSNGILEAAGNALENAKVTSAPTATPTPDPTETLTPTPKPTETPDPTPEGQYVDGNYNGSGDGNYGVGSVTVNVTISGGKITAASYDTIDDEEYFAEAWNGIYGQILNNQSADGVDAVSGATYSSNGILQAFQNALSQAKRQ